MEVKINLLIILQPTRLAQYVMEKFSSTIQAATFMISPFTAEKIIYKPKINE